MTIMAEFSPGGRLGDQPLVIEASDYRSLIEQLVKAEADARKYKSQRDGLLALIERLNDNPNERQRNG